ncbi:flagellar biosynthesis protein FlhF [Neobacillus sp. FSL H8-0543]|uniref:flagellar biosynthesis protein FlhF n=1 Tax=Neobacillus sp. FSL H8-0543 TaxID=2954672 RepID=UPI0031598BD1
MRIKTYVVKNETDAYPLIMNDLGTDAFILNTKPIRSGGYFGLFRKKRVEVVAAADVSPQAETKRESEWKSPLLERKIERQSFENWQSKRQESRLSEAPTGQPLLSQQEVMKELSEVKGLINTLLKEDRSVESNPKHLEKWVHRLREQEVDEEVIDYIVKKAKLRIKDKETVTEQSIEQTFLAILEQLFEEGITKDTGINASFISLVGPTGVGKTTTIAKLAAVSVFHQRQKVGLLTTDTFRIAAVEQLKTYASILNIPLEVVNNANELKSAMEVLKSCQIIFMDSAGRNYLEEEYIDEINQFLRYDAPQENYLVLSMTTRWRDMRNIVEQMKAVPIDKLILTKWDETLCYGIALNMVYHYPYPLSYVSMGQGVPQDIMLADPVFMAKKILGVDENESRSSTSIKTII